MYFIHQDLIALKIEKKKKIEITKKIKKGIPEQNSTQNTEKILKTLMIDFIFSKR